MPTDGEAAPDCIDEQQSSHDKEHIADANLGGNVPAQEGAGEHADELGRLIEAIDTAQADRRCELPDQVVGRWHEPCNGDAMDEAQQSELPGSCDQSLRDGDKTSQRQAGEQDPMRADAVGKVAEARSKEHAGKACT